MNKKSSVLALASMLAAMSNGDGSLMERNPLRPEDIDVTPKKCIIPKGCSVYNINGKEIIALNEKSAIRKANKL